MKKVILCVALVSSVFANETITVEESYSKALEYEAKVRSYGYQVQAKGEDVEQAKSKLYPKVDAQLQATSRNYILNGTDSTIDENFYTVGISANIPVYHPEYFNDIEQSKLKLRYSKVHLAQLKQELAFDVTDAYMLIVRAKNSLKVAEAYLKANRSIYSRIQKLYEKNLANKIDLLSSKVTYEQSKIKVNTEKNMLRLAKNKFRNLTNISDVKVPQVNLENINSSDISKLSILYTKEDLLSSNLDIKKANLGIYITEKQIENSNYGHYPKIDLSATTSRYDAENRYTDYDQDTRVSLNIKIPLYQGGYIESNKAKYRYLLSAANEDKKDTTRKILSDYEEIAIKLNTSKENIALYIDSIKSSELYLHAVTKGYEKGLRKLIDIDDAKTKLYETKFKLIDSVYLYIKSYTSLLKTFGLLNRDKLKQLDSIVFSK